MYVCTYVCTYVCMYGIYVLDRYVLYIYVRTLGQWNLHYPQSFVII